MTRILIVEDEVSFSDPLSYLLSKEGYEVSVAENGNDALTEFDATGADLVLLDLMLPGLSGVDVCRALRQRSNVPVIMLTAKDSEIDKVVGLELGADDYVTKPYSSRELLARIKAVLRRLAEPEEMLPPRLCRQQAGGAADRGRFLPCSDPHGAGHHQPPLANDTQAVAGSPSASNGFVAACTSYCSCATPSRQGTTRTLADRDRPLNNEGARTAGAMRKTMLDLGLTPDLVLVSPSRRTRETLAGLEPWDDTPLVERGDALPGDHAAIARGPARRE